MNDLEREIRERFVGAGARLSGPGFAPDRAPAGLLRRTRRRQAATAAIALAAVAAVVVASVAGVSSLLRTSERRIPAVPPPGSIGPLAAVPMGTDFTDLTVDADGTLWWIGPGLTRFEPASGSVRTYTAADDGYAFGDIGAIASARDGGVWMLAWEELATGTVARFDGEEVHEVLEPGPLCDVAEAPDGTLFGSGCGKEGVLRWDGASWTPVPNKGRPTAVAVDLTVDPSGGLWVSNWHPSGERVAVSRFNGSTWTTWSRGDVLPSDAVYAIEFAPDGDVWLGTGDGVVRFSDGGWYTYPDSATGIARVFSIAATGDEVWIAGSDRTARFDGTSWTPVTATDSLDIDDTGEIQLVEAAGSVWAATSAGLYRFDGDRWELVLPNEAPVWVETLAAAGGDEVWVTSTGEGAWRLRGDAWTHFGESDGLEGLVNDMAVGPDGTVWAATERGLARLDGSAWKVVASGRHEAVAFGPDGEPWSASGGPESQPVGPVVGVPWTGGGVPESQLVGPVGRTPIAEHVPLTCVTSLAVVSETDVWAGCLLGTDMSGGLAHFDGASWTRVEPVAGAGDPYVFDIEVTPGGDVWVSCGVPAENDQVAFVLARGRSGRWTTMREADGIRLDTPSQGWFGTPGSLDLTPNGDLLLASWQGLFVLREGAWHLLQEGTFTGLSVGTEGTVWLEGASLFRFEGDID